MIITYSGRSMPSALRIADEDYDIELRRSSRSGDINWGRATANTTLNPDITNSTNKRVMRELFAEHGVPMPKLYERLEIWLRVVQGKVLVGRPDQHTKGRGFWKCETRHDIVKALRGTRRKAAATHFMEYIEAPHEYRVHIFRGKSIRISEKQFDAEHHYTTVKPTGRVDHVRKAAKAAVAALGLDFGAVDILASDDECWVLEVNAAPGIGGSLPRLYAKTMKEWYESESQ